MARILAFWRRFLESPDSRNVLRSSSDSGWLGPTTLEALERLGNAPYNTSLKFCELYQCDSSDEHYGFNSWDGECPTRLRFQVGIQLTGQSRLLRTSTPAWVATRSIARRRQRHSKRLRGQPVQRRP